MNRPFKKGKIESSGWMLFFIAFASCAATLEAGIPMRRTVTLKDGWLVKQIEPGTADANALTSQAARPDKTWMAARMPAQVHEILLSRGEIPDPRMGKNAAASAWVGEKDWAYACSFPSPQDLSGPVFLRFDGLDTIAAAYLNGVEIGRFQDMFVEYSVEVGRHLAAPGRDNILLIVFFSPLNHIADIEKTLSNRPPEVGRYKYIRKSSGDFSSYLGARPHAVKVGIYRDVRLDIPGPSWFEGVWIKPELGPGFRTGRFAAEVKASGRPSSFRWTVLDPGGSVLIRNELPPEAGLRMLSGEIASPRLWWPWTHGKPDLYSLKVELLIDGAVVDERTTSFGFRDIKLVTKDTATGEPQFRFDINGQPVFLMGANWIPVEGLTHVWDPIRAKTLIDLAVQGRMNVFRVWGEGYVPPREFYDECDRRGILIWQDFMFGYGPYPTGVAGLDSLYKADVEDMIVRLRNHACLLLWCGGNENHMGWDFARRRPPMPGQDLFDKVIPSLCVQLDPSRPYHPSSPFGGPTANWALEGDWHDYSTLWFLPQASVPLFGSEVGRVSTPSYRSMARFLGGSDLWPSGFDPDISTPGKAAWPPMWQYRSVDGSWDKVGPLEQYVEPAGPEDLIRVIGSAHGEYLRDRVERMRRGVPDGAPDGARRSWGNITWRHNDCWPIIYWSVIDYYLEPKIAYYYLRRAYDPVLVSLERTPDRLSVWIVNDSTEAVRGTLNVRHMDWSGRVLGELSAEVDAAPGAARRSLVLDALGPVSLRGEFLQARFGGKTVDWFLGAERYLHLPEATLAVRWNGDVLELRSDRYVRQIVLDGDGVKAPLFEDNYFDLGPNETRLVKLLDPSGAATFTVRGLNAGPVEIRRPPIS